MHRPVAHWKERKQRRPGLPAVYPNCWNMDHRYVSRAFIQHQRILVVGRNSDEPGRFADLDRTDHFPACDIQDGDVGAAVICHEQVGRSV